ncbi:DUF167 domain-containing protein [Mangrovihabitans endophyticus]|uniref:UPF0235 protein GCM10012284_10330 n=1 Tax=Mangrovihabitans endophyticus TaxID=1751298 RepID=A0A8J3BWS0_9ACTN|nr:hypothetical protein GCM10012284_10330 [Mangrovihabitans endophyticus]
MTSIAIRVKPGASRPAVGGAYQGPFGPALVIAVREPPADGRATKAALRALAEAIGVRPSRLALKAGAISRDKLVLVEDPPENLAERVAALLEGGR